MNPKKSFHDITPQSKTVPVNLGDIRDLPLPPTQDQQIKQTNIAPTQPNFSSTINNNSTNESAKSANVTANIPDVPLAKTPIETPRPAANNSVPWLRDILGLAIFVSIVVIGAWLINLFIFRTFNVVGPSMEPTLDGGAAGSVVGAPSDRLVINLLPVTSSRIAGKNYTPERGQIIVFKNPTFTTGNADEYIVKRVIGLPGERVAVNDCTLKVYNSENPTGFDPYPDFKNFAKNDSEMNPCISGDGTDIEVPNNEIFVVGDHRVDNYSMDSRNGDGRSTLGTIPLNDIIGPVSLRVWPLNKLKMF